MDMPLEVFKSVQNTSWICCNCGSPNCSTTIYETFIADSIATENSYSSLSEDEAHQNDPESPVLSTSSQSFSSLDSSIGNPQHMSSPRGPLTSTCNTAPVTARPRHDMLRVLTVNFQSIKAKKTPFWLLLEETNPDIVIGCETWLHPGIYEREVIPNGYHFVARKDRATDHHGGVIIAAKDSLIGTEIPIQTSAEFVAASFNCQGQAPLIIGAIYRPPKNDQAYTDELCNKIRDLQSQYQKATIWIAGDANLPDIDWESQSICGHNYLLKINQTLLNTVYDVGFEQIVKFPTRGENTLDIFLTNRPSLIGKCKAVPGVSDHDIVFVEASTRAVKTKPQRRKILLWKQVDIENLKPDVLDFSTKLTSQYSADNDVNILWDSLKEFTSNLLDEKVPSKMTSARFGQPWINRKIKRISRRKKRAYKKAKLSRSDKDIQRYKQLQKESQFECRKAYNGYVNDVVTSDNSKKLYSFIKGKRCDSSGIAPLKKNGMAHSDPKIKATILNEQFCSVFTEDSSTNLPSMGDSPFPDMHDFNVNEEGVRKLLQGLNPHKAEGPDHIPTRFLKEFATELTPAMTLIFQASLQQGEIPDEWRQANIAPVFKKGDRSVAANYRPISLTSVCSKVLEHIIHSQVMKHLDAHQILTDQQHGFRKKRSCESQLILTLQDLASALEENEQIDAILLDFSKAFDKVSHQRLAIKLHHYGIRGHLLKWIQSFLANRSQQVMVEGHASTPAPVTSGVPQGTVLGPLLFLIYINDLPMKVSSTTRLFADDSLLYRRIRSPEDARILQEDLDKLQDWEKEWQMSFNPIKCEVIRVTNKRNPIRTPYQIHGHDLTVAKTGKYLGVTISSDLSWNAHVDATVKKANNSLSFLRRNLARCPKDVKAQSYQTMVRPILEYASTSWDPHSKTNIEKIEAVQRRAARFVYGDYKTTSSPSQMIADLGWETLCHRRANAKLVMMYRITYGLIDIPGPAFLHPSTLRTRGNTLRYLVPYSRTDAYRHSFFPSAIRLWNQLPECVVITPTLDAFKLGLASRD